jgi:hypothetical protein
MKAIYSLKNGITFNRLHGAISQKIVLFVSTSDYLCQQDIYDYPSPLVLSAISVSALTFKGNNGCRKVGVYLPTHIISTKHLHFKLTTSIPVQCDTYEKQKYYRDFCSVQKSILTKVINIQMSY